MKENDLSSIYQILNSSRIRMYQHGFERSEDWCYQLRQDPYNRIYLITSGRGHLKNSSESIKLTPGYAYFIPRDLIYTMDTDSWIEMFWIHFDLEILPGIDMGDRIRECFRIPMILEENDILRTDCYSRQAGDILTLKGRVLQICGYFINEKKHCFQGDTLLVRKYKELFPFLSTQLNVNHSVETYARIMGMSSASFYRHFSRDFGCSPKDFQQRRILRRACHLLIHSSRSTKEIAGELGFRETSYFSRFFKKRTGTSPSSYRKEFLYIPEIAGRDPLWNIYSID